VIVASLLLAACGSATSPAPQSAPVPSAPLASSSASPTSGPSVDSTAPPSLPHEASATLPVHASGRAIGERILIAPGPGGTLFVSIPRTDGSVLAFLDRSGQPRPGWPIAISNTTACDTLLPVDDGSVRVVCDATDLPPPELHGVDARAHAFDAAGQPMAGWPIELLPELHIARVVGAVMTLLQRVLWGDVGQEGQPDGELRIDTIAPDGDLETGTPTDWFGGCCHWEIGPDGRAYGIELVSGMAEGEAEVSEITALDLAGVPDGWPASFDGIASGPAFGPGGRIVLTVGSYVRRTSRVMAFDHDGRAVTSVELPIATGALLEFGVDGPYDCGVPSPRPPLAARDGTIFVFSEVDVAIVAVDASLELMPGWPYRPPSPFADRDEPTGGDLTCSSLALPAVGPDSTLYLPLQARSDSVGGSLVAIGPDGRLRPGWPVELRRPGAEFWSVTVGSDGTAYALAIEPEAGGASSASILAIAPDSTVRWTTTIVDP